MKNLLRAICALRPKYWHRRNLTFKGWIYVSQNQNKTEKFVLVSGIEKNLYILYSMLTGKPEHSNTVLNTIWEYKIIK